MLAYGTWEPLQAAVCGRMCRLASPPRRGARTLSWLCASALGLFGSLQARALSRLSEQFLPRGKKAQIAVVYVFFLPN